MTHASIEDVRGTINQLDTQMVKLLCKREQAVKAAATFKINSEAVKAPYCVETVIKRVKELAIKEGGNPDIIESIYREMISQFIHMR